MSKIAAKISQLVAASGSGAGQLWKTPWIFRAAVYEAMLLRMNGQFDAAEQLLAYFRMDAERLFSLESLNFEIPADAQALLYCLAASMARRDNDFALSQRLLDKAESIDSYQFQIAFQRGLNALCHSQYQDSLRDFLESKKHLKIQRSEFSKHHNPNDRTDDATDLETVTLQKVFELSQVFIDFNILICQEYLGLAYEDDLAEFLKLIKQLCDHHHEFSVVGSLADQAYCMQLRLWFRTGNIAALREIFDLLRTEWTQSLYYGAWVLSLPQNQGEGDKKRIQRALKTLSINSSHGFLAGYDLDTLMGIYRQDSFKNETPRVTEQVERIYLWSWRWLEQPTSDLLTAIARQIQQLFASDHEQAAMSKDDFLLIEIVFMMMDLFAPNLFEGIRAKSMAPKLSYQSMKNLETELNCFKVLWDALNQQQKVSKILDLIACDSSSSGSAYLAKLAQNPRHPFAQFLQSRFLSSENINVDHCANVVIKIDLVHGEITANGVKKNAGNVAEGSGKILSYSCANILAAVLKSKNISLDEAVGVGFGYRVFDEDRHGARLAKVLTKINKLGDNQFKVHRRGSSLSLIGEVAEYVLKGDTLLERQMSILRSELLERETKESLENLNQSNVSVGKFIDADSKKDRNKYHLPTSFSRGTIITRSDIESLFNVGKTRASAVIKDLIYSKSLEPIGVGKATKYRVLKTINSK